MSDNPLVVTLAKEYLDTIRRITFAGGDLEEIRMLEGQRAVLHDQLLGLLGMDQSSVEDMVKLAQTILLDARAKGWTE